MSHKQILNDHVDLHEITTANKHTSTTELELDNVNTRRLLCTENQFCGSTCANKSTNTLWKTRSLNAPPPLLQFGPCGRIMKNSVMVMQVQDPAGQRLTWYKSPLTVLVIKKVNDVTVLAPFVELIEWLVLKKHMVVWIEAAVIEEKLFQTHTEAESSKEKSRHKKFQTIRERFQQLRDKLITFKDGCDELNDRIDFIICIGGDGTLLYASQLFQQSVPPVMAFHLGSLGFLMPFRFDNFQQQITNVLEGHAALTLRSRLRCVLHKQNMQPQAQQASTDDKTESNLNGTAKLCDNMSKTILVLNDVVISRGLSSYLSNINLHIDGKYITSVQGDGLIVSTPTGSTAYAVGAGASMIHPAVPAIMITPICPHSLSFRPIVVPAGVELKITISADSRNTSWISFDGRNRQELYEGDSLYITTSIYPVPSICAEDQVADWFNSLANGLHWNVRKRQKSLNGFVDMTQTQDVLAPENVHISASNF